MTLKIQEIDTTKYFGEHRVSDVKCGPVYVVTDLGTGDQGLVCFNCLGQSGDPGFTVEPHPDLKLKIERERMKGA